MILFFKNVKRPKTKANLLLVAVVLSLRLQAYNHDSYGNKIITVDF